MAAITPTGKSSGIPEQGFTYLGLLFVVAVMGLTMALAAQVWETSRRREQEAELLFVGNQFRQAIGQYYAGSPSSDKHYPMSLEDLLKDKRSPNTRRYLRKIYRDPLTNSTQWGLVMAEEGGIQGVYSTAQGTPIKMTGFPTENADFEKTKSYAEWKFVYVPDGSDTSANTEESDGSEAPVDDNSFYN